MGELHWGQVMPEPEAAGAAFGAGNSPDCDWCSYAARMKSGEFPAPKAAPAASGSGMTCPQCNSPMVQRSGRYGEFWGCTKYPECKGTRKIQPA